MTEKITPNISKEFVSQVVDEIERRKSLDSLRDSLNWSAVYMDKNEKERKSTQEELDTLNNISSWWNRWFLSKRIKRCEKELERLNNNISLTAESMKILLNHYNRLKGL